MNMTSAFVGGAGILVAAYLKKGFGLKGVFAGISMMVMTAAFLLLIGYRFFLNKDLQACVEDEGLSRANSPEA
jgi:hypothetical protein